MIVGLLFLMTIYNIELLSNRQSRSYDNEGLKTFDFWPLSYININGNDEWAFTALNQDWCSGSGHWTDPYIIENVVIEEKSSFDYGIRIRNSDVYFKIINCTVNNIKYDDHAGGCTAITFYHVSNGCIIKNRLSFNEIALELESCYNITIIGNNITYNDQNGVRILYSENNTICDNNISYTFSNGIYQVFSKYNNFSRNLIEYNSNAVYVHYSNSTIVSNNTIKNNRNWGVTFLGDLSTYYFNEVIDNTIENNSFGIWLNGGSHDKIINNRIIRNRQDGIRLVNLNNSHFYNNIITMNGENGISSYSYNNNNTFYGNDLIHNINYGINLGGIYNKFYLNNFSFNGINAQGNGGTCNWDNGSIGNYWSDYEGYDIDGDGIGETPYEFNFVIDNYPLTTRRDIFKPIIIIEDPISSQVFGDNAPQYSLIIEEYLLNLTWYTLDGGITNITFTGLSGIINQTIWDTISIGDITLTFFAKDLAGNIGKSEIIIKKRVINQISISFSNFYLIFVFGVLITILYSKMRKKLI